MTVISFMDKLLDSVDVEWKVMDEAGEFLRGKRFVKKDMLASGVPCIHYGEMYTHYGISAYQAKSFLDETVASKLRTAKAGDVIIVAAGEKIDDIGNGVAWLGEGDVVFHDACFSFKSELDSKYVSYYLRTRKFKDQIKKSISSGKISSINAKGLGKALIPIPCPESPEKSLEIQAEIVRILDSFTELTSELTTELTTELNARKKQYNYYRDQLLSFEEGTVEHLPLGQEGIGEFVRGGSFQKKDFTESGVGCIHYGQVFTHYGTFATKTKTFVSEELAKKCRKAQPGNLIIATTSENDEDVCKAVAWLGKEDIAVSSDACIYKHNLNPKYVSYFFQTEHFQTQKRRYITGAKVRRVNADNLAKILIPVPSPEEQARIVAILDKFDAITSSITEALPREIELRQKQYEYYRDLLLSFPKPDTEVAA